MKEIIRHGFVFGIRPGSRNGGAGSNYRMPILGELGKENERGGGCKRVEEKNNMPKKIILK